MAAQRKERMSKDNKSAKAFDFAASRLQAEISLFWQRSLFFWGFIAAAFVAYGVVVKEKDIALALVVACFGLVCSIAWTLANRGSKYWQVAWEKKLKTEEVEVLGSDLFSRLEQNTDQSWWGAARYSVTRLTIGDFSVLVWIALGYNASPIGQGVPWTYETTTIVAITVFYVVAILLGARTRIKPT